ncbi:MAG: hypothetical protein ACO25F_06785 [Erythrobacter sp.]
MTAGFAMTVSSELIQFLGSLVAILALAGIARWLKLGRNPTLADDVAGMTAAAEAVDGFEAVAQARDLHGLGAILRDGSGRVLVLKPHGSHFAGRILTGAAKATVWQDLQHRGLYVDCGERRFGGVYLEIDQPEAWVEAINRLGSPRDA